MKSQNLKEGDKCVHKFYPEEFTCEIVCKTNKGFKYLVTRTKGKKSKTKTDFGYDLDFCAEKGHWVKVKEDSPSKNL